MLKLTTQYGFHELFLKLLLQVLSERVLLQVLSERVLLQVLSERVLLQVLSERVLLQVLSERVLLHARRMIPSGTGSSINRDIVPLIVIILILYRFKFTTRCAM
jgi:hypothetical protein